MKSAKATLRPCLTLLIILSLVVTGDLSVMCIASDGRTYVEPVAFGCSSGNCEEDDDQSPHHDPMVTPASCTDVLLSGSAAIRIQRKETAELPLDTFFIAIAAALPTVDTPFALPLRPLATHAPDASQLLHLRVTRLLI